MEIDDKSYKKLINLLSMMEYYDDKESGPELIEVALWVTQAKIIKEEIT